MACRAAGWARPRHVAVPSTLLPVAAAGNVGPSSLELSEQGLGCALVYAVPVIKVLAGAVRLAALILLHPLRTSLQAEGRPGRSRSGA